MKLLEIYNQLLENLTFDQKYDLLKKLEKEYTKEEILFDELVFDLENLKTAVNNIKGDRPSMSKDSLIHVAKSSNGKYYLLDGYHRVVEYVLEGKVGIVGAVLNKSYEELKELDVFGIGCDGYKEGMTSYNEFCSNFKQLGSIDIIKRAFPE